MVACATQVPNGYYGFRLRSVIEGGGGGVKDPATVKLFENLRFAGWQVLQEQGGVVWAGVGWGMRFVLVSSKPFHTIKGFRQAQTDSLEVCKKSVALWSYCFKLYQLFF